MDLTHLYDNLGEWYQGHTGTPNRMNAKLDQELTKLLYKQAPSVVLSLVALLVAAIYFFWGKLPSHYLIIWVVANVVAIGALVHAIWQYRNTQDASCESRRWINRYTYLVLLQDVAWGMIGPLSFLIDNEIYRVLTLFMLGGMSAGSIVTRGVVFKAYTVCVLGLLTPIIITLSLQGDTLSEGMFFLTLIYLFFMLSVARNYSNNIKHNILLWVDNEKLVSELKQSKAEVEDANRVLLSEIEQRKRVESELVNARDVAQRANASKNQFLANVSHELRTPLNGIIGFTSILEKEHLAEEQQRYVAQIGKSAGSLLRIVNDILDITSIEAGQLKLYEEGFSLQTEMGEVLAILKPMAQRKSLELSYTIDKGVVDWLHGDPNRLRQIVSNLLSNALKYTEKGSVTLHISHLGNREGKEWIRFAVEDTGIGIDQQELNKLFDYFTRVERFETRHNEGVGLGLAIVKNLVQQMGGMIHVDSRPDEGSCFTVELPFAKGMVMPDYPYRKVEDVMPQTSLYGLKVLVVDDNDVNRLVLSTFLSKNSVNYDQAKSGTEALELIRERDYDVVLLDIQMPDISGIDVAKEVMGMSKDIPTLVAVTAHAFPEQRETIIKAGFSDFLLKPISEVGLITLLSRIAKGERGNRAGQRIGM